MSEEFESTTELTLKLELPGKTIKKLKAFAMLTGMSIDQLEAELLSQIQPELANHFDRSLSTGIAQKLSELDGTSVRIFSESEAVAEDSHTESDTDDHSLSSDDDNEENLSVEEQVERDKTLPKSLGVARTLKAPSTPLSRSLLNSKEASDPDEPHFDIDAPDAGEDAEQFLDSAMAEETSSARSRSTGQQSPFGYMTPAKGSFDAKKPRVKVSEHTGDESGMFS